MRRFLVRGKILVACLVFLTATSAFAQHAEFGIKTDLPRTDIMKTGFGGFDAHTKGYTIRPVYGYPLSGAVKRRNRHNVQAD
jgi:hypothetical protein